MENHLLTDGEVDEVKLNGNEIERYHRVCQGIFNKHPYLAYQVSVFYRQVY
jgi:hypothetical protein